MLSEEKVELQRLGKWKLSSWTEKLPEERVGLGLSLIADVNQKQNHNSVSMFLQTGQEARQPYFFPPVSLGHSFFHTRRAGEEGMGAVLGRISGAILPSWGSHWKKSQGFPSERTFTLERSLLEGEEAEGPDHQPELDVCSRSQPGAKVGFRCRGWPLGRQNSHQLPGSPGTGSRGVGSLYSAGVGGTRGSANKILSLWVVFFLPAPQSTWCSLALGPGPFVVAESEHRGQDNSWGLIAGRSVLPEVSGAPKLELRGTEEKWDHPAKPRRVTTSALRADLAQTDGKQKQGERIEDEPTI